MTTVAYDLTPLTAADVDGSYAAQVAIDAAFAGIVEDTLTTVAYDLAPLVDADVDGSYHASVGISADFGGQVWTRLASDVAGGEFEDHTAEPGVVYQYRVGDDGAWLYSDEVSLLVLTTVAYDLTPLVFTDGMYHAAVAVEAAFAGVAEFPTVDVDGSYHASVAVAAEFGGEVFTVQRFHSRISGTHALTIGGGGKTGWSIPGGGTIETNEEAR